MDTFRSLSLITTLRWKQTEARRAAYPALAPHPCLPPLGSQGWMRMAGRRTFLIFTPLTSCLWQWGGRGRPLYWSAKGSKGGRRGGLLLFAVCDER
jgi:hypothetical protein